MTPSPPSRPSVRVSRPTERLCSATIFRHYARSWLVLDIVASVPYDWLSEGVSFSPPPTGADGNGDGSTAQLTQLLRIFRLVKLLRLLRVAKLFRYLGKWEEHLLFINMNMIRLFKLLVGVFFFSHWNGCLQVHVLRRQSASPRLPPLPPPPGYIGSLPSGYVGSAEW